MKRLQWRMKVEIHMVTRLLHASTEGGIIGVIMTLMLGRITY